MKKSTRSGTVAFAGLLTACSGRGATDIPLHLALRSRRFPVRRLLEHHVALILHLSVRAGDDLEGEQLARGHRLRSVCTDLGQQTRSVARVGKQTAGNGNAQPIQSGPLGVVAIRLIERNALAVVIAELQRQREMESPWQYLEIDLDGAALAGHLDGLA